MTDKERQQLSYALNFTAASVALNFVTLFVVALWWNTSGSDPSWDAVSVSLTVLEVFLAIIALGGFWLFRGIVKEHAATVARDVACNIAEEEAKETAGIVAARAAEEAIATKLGNGEESTKAQVAAFGEEEEENGT